jgi:hypothetical protein
MSSTRLPKRISHQLGEFAFLVDDVCKRHHLSIIYNSMSLSFGKTFNTWCCSDAMSLIMWALQNLVYVDEICVQKVVDGVTSNGLLDELKWFLAEGYVPSPTAIQVALENHYTCVLDTLLAFHAL